MVCLLVTNRSVSKYFERVNSISTFVGGKMETFKDRLEEVVQQFAEGNHSEFARHLLANDANMKKISVLMGHTEVSTTEWYTHVLAGFLTETTDRLNDRLAYAMGENVSTRNSDNDNALSEPKASTGHNGKVAK